MWVHAKGTLGSSIRNYLVGAGLLFLWTKKGSRCSQYAFMHYWPRQRHPFNRSAMSNSTNPCLQLPRGRMKHTTLRPPPTPLSSHAPQVWLSSEMPLGGYGLPLPDANKFEASSFSLRQESCFRTRCQRIDRRKKEGQRKSTC